MTKLSSPVTSEYNFQFTESHDTNYLTLRLMLDNAGDMDMVDVIGKLVYKDNEIVTVGASKLKKTNCYIADETASIKLILWESKIEEVKVEEVYMFKQVRLCRDGCTAQLNTTVDTVIERKVDHNLKEELVVENITPEKDIADAELEMKVETIHSIGEFSRFKQCVHCNKKISQIISSATVKCDHCGHIRRSASCKGNLMIKFLVENNDKSDEGFLHFVVFQDILEEMIGVSVKSTTNDTILEKLLLLKNFTILYNNKRIVKRVVM